MYNYYVKYLETGPKKECQHYKRHHILINKIKRPTRKQESDRIKDTLKPYDMRSRGVHGIIEKGESSRMCDGCLQGGACKNNHLVLG